jgi:glycosyltransferase involved in cell wall biosynthesis
VRILVVGHTYVVAENQKQLDALAARSGVELAVVVPRAWRDPLHGELRAHVPDRARFSLQPLPAIGTGYEQFYVYVSADVALRRFRPDVLYVEQGAGSFVYAQVLTCRSLYARRAKAVFFTWWNLPYRARWPLSAVERFNLRRSQGAVAGNSEAAEILRDHGFSGPLLVLPQLGVDPVAFRRRDAADLRRTLTLTGFTIGFVGRLAEEKGLRVLLDALSAAPFDFHLLLVGGGPLAPEIRATALAHGWATRLTMIDVVAHEAVAGYMACMDVLVLPSLERAFAREQFGHVLIEAMACEVPVVGSRCGEIPQIIDGPGVIVPQDDAEALRKALADLAGSAADRRRRGERGRQRVLDRFTHARIAERLHDFLRAI